MQCGSISNPRTAFPIAKIAMLSYIFCQRGALPFASNRLTGFNLYFCATAFILYSVFRRCTMNAAQNNRLHVVFTYHRLYAIRTSSK